MGVIVRKAEPEDTLQLQRLLAKAGVTEQVYDEQPTEFIVAETEDKSLVGTAGLTVLTKEEVLLRSLVIDSEKTGAVFLLEFLETATAFARQKSFTSLYLMTSGQQGFLEQVGFSTLAENSIPHSLKQSEHYRKNVKRSPKVMHMCLTVNN
ncbi:hypothetical protein CR205_17160 [Alteribacter lacisalsi]|uniref:N-acetyltransferase domain-containing protein n=1 Tax=Alteribacter lacisalsi TaxID=2045244 RepID=A0A2W0H4K3_9BACI|nr:hypothetical protein [Alteribacter lacisalsi]PYZ96097.1 hypothetical protein CR205_17160 [Alteribacter lacisalsi]